MSDREPFDPYAVLGVVRTASAEEIRAAYHALVARYHPDRHQGNPLEGLASEKMIEINRAEEILSDPVRRAAFDSQARMGFSGGTANPAASREAGIDIRTGKVLATIIPLILALLLLFRFGRFLVRLLAVLFRYASEGASVIRGTPFAMGAMLLVLLVLLIALVRRRPKKPKP